MIFSRDTDTRTCVRVVTELFSIFFIFSEKNVRVLIICVSVLHNYYKTDYFYLWIFKGRSSFLNDSCWSTLNSDC